MQTILAIIFVLFVLIFVHELGHFLAARSVGIRVDRFFIGFNFFGLGLKKKIGDTEYGLGLIPLGGYVKVAGIVDESMDTELTGAKWEFQSKNALQKAWYISAGVVANMLLAVLIFFSLTLANGIAEADPSTEVGSISVDYPAEAAGILPGDKITAINGTEVGSWGELTAIIHAQPEAEIEVSWTREGQAFSEVMEPRATETLIDDEIVVVGMIGIGPVVTTRPAGFGEAVVSGFTLTGQWFMLTFRSLAMIISGKASIKDIGGPIMIAQMAGQYAQTGFSNLLGLLAIISVNLALINILPVPALDGGHLAIILVESAMRRPLSMRVRMVVQQLGVMLLLALIAVIIFNDITRIIQQ